MGKQGHHWTWTRINNSEGLGTWSIDIYIPAHIMDKINGKTRNDGNGNKWPCKVYRELISPMFHSSNENDRVLRVEGLRIHSFVT